MIEIRSYRRVFDLERRIYSVDRFRLNPAGVPVRGIVYLILGVGFVLALGAMPVLGALARVLPWYVTDLLIPGIAATLLSVIRLEGRSFHLAAGGLLGMTVGPRSISGLTRPSGVGAHWLAPELILLPDGSEPELRRLGYRGPGAVLVGVEHRREGVLERGRVGLGSGRATLRLTAPASASRSARSQVIVLERGGRLIVDPLAGKRDR